MTSQTFKNLRSLGRVNDCKGGILTFDIFVDAVYRIRRARMASDAGEHLISDAFMSDGTYHRFNLAMVGRLTNKYGPSAVQMQSRVPASDDSPMEYSKYDLPEVGCYIAAFTDWTCLWGPGFPNRSLYLLGLYDISMNGDVRHPEYHFVFENFSGFDFR